MNAPQLFLSASLSLPPLGILVILSFSSVDPVGSLPGSANDVEDAVSVRCIPPQAIIFRFCYPVQECHFSWF